VIYSLTLYFPLFFVGGVCLRRDEALKAAERILVKRRLMLRTVSMFEQKLIVLSREYGLDVDFSGDKVQKAE